MTPETAHLLGQEIRHHRALLTVRESWLQRQPRSETQAEGFRQINFWRGILKHAEERLRTTGLADADLDDRQTA